MTDTKHTPVPRKYEVYQGNPILKDDCVWRIRGGGYAVAESSSYPRPCGAEMRANAELIVRAVNAHEALVGALKEIVAEAAEQAGEVAWYYIHADRITKARAALALARGEK